MNTRTSDEIQLEMPSRAEDYSSSWNIGGAIPSKDAYELARVGKKEVLKVRDLLVVHSARAHFI